MPNSAMKLNFEITLSNESNVTCGTARYQKENRFLKVSFLRLAIDLLCQTDVLNH